MLSGKKTLPQDMANTIGLIFLLERRMEYLFDKILASHNLTTKQWLLLSVIERAGVERPSIQDVARQLNTSHQNVKQIAVNLERRGFLVLERDRKDKRVTRLYVTPECKEFWQAREGEDIDMFLELFQQVSEPEIKDLSTMLMKLLYGVQETTDRIMMSNRDFN